MKSKSVRFTLLLVLPPMALAVGLAALVTSNASGSGSQFLFDLSTTTWLDLSWSIVSTIVIFFFWKFPGVLSRTAAWITGIVGYAVWLTTNVVPPEPLRSNETRSRI
jgi:hypothetical protein